MKWVEVGFTVMNYSYQFNTELYFKIKGSKIERWIFKLTQNLVKPISVYLKAILTLLILKGGQSWNSLLLIDATR